MLSKSNF
jgi:hypothetical protein